MAITKDQLARLAQAGGNVLSSTGGKIGSVGQVWVDDVTGEPTWVTVKTGLFGTAESFVPLQGAAARGDDITVDYDKDTVKEAPQIDADQDLSPGQESTLYSYYGLGDAGRARDASEMTGGPAAAADERDNATYAAVSGDRANEMRAGTVGQDTSGRASDDAMTRSEERLNVGTQERESGRARLRKYVVTENVTQTVPVSREEVRVEREPITDANVDAATSGPDISEDEHEVILHEERPTVEREAVPVERVRLDTETVTDQATVSEEVRKEKIDTETEGNAAPER